MNVYRTEQLLSSKDVNMFRRLRSSVLFELMQDIAEQQNELLGLGRAAAQELGLFWVLVRQRAEISRMPERGERITLETWPGRTRHMLFPRYYRMLDASEAVLLSAASVWTLVDRESRKMVSPEKYSLSIPCEVTGNEIALPRPMKFIRDGANGAFTVPFSYIDMNGHMNNARYLDLAEDGSAFAGSGKPLNEITVEYSAEAHVGDKLSLCRRETGSSAAVSGSSGGKKIFSAVLQYRE